MIATLTFIILFKVSCKDSTIYNPRLKKNIGKEFNVKGKLYEYPSTYTTSLLVLSSNY